MIPRPVTEDDLNRFVDGDLDAERRGEILAYLDQHPDVARRIAGYAGQGELLRALYGPIADEPLPPELNLSRMIEDRRRRPGPARWLLAAAAAILVCLGGAGGWILRDRGFLAATGTAIAREASASYVVYAHDRMRPVEIRADDRQTLAAWMRQSIGRPVMIPDLDASGYRFMGGRVVPTSAGAAALLMYDDDRGLRLAVLARPMAGTKDMPMSPHREDGVNGYVWADDGLAYSLVGAAPAERLHPLADEVRRQIQSGA